MEYTEYTGDPAAVEVVTRLTDRAIGETAPEIGARAIEGTHEDEGTDVLADDQLGIPTDGVDTQAGDEDARVVDGAGEGVGVDGEAGKIHESSDELDAQGKDTDDNLNDSTAESITLPEHVKEYHNRTGQKETYLSPTISALVADRLLTKKNWEKVDNIEAEFGLDAGSITAQIRNLGDAYSNHIVIIDREGVESAYISPVAALSVRQEIENKPNPEEITIQIETPEQAQKRLENEVVSFLDEVIKGETLDAQDFQRLVKLFSGEKAIDLLYHFHPEMNKVPMPKVKSMLAEYLGDFLSPVGVLDLESLEVGIGLLDKPSLKDGLGEVIKQHCLRQYNQAKSINPEADDLDLMAEAINKIKTETADFTNSDDLNELLYQLEDYYLSLFDGIDKPDYIVERLRKDRMLPDINQRINIRELEINKKLLIADEMGLGKSASAIMAKECLGVNKALIVVPSNVIETWQTYLSDEIGENGVGAGYFREGQAPNVLVVENIDQLNKADLSEYDYVLISVEKLSLKYQSALSEQDFDMLIIDEVHKFKNINYGKRAEALIRLASDFECSDSGDKYLALLSGTPIPNKVSDVALLLKLLYPEKFESVSNKQLTQLILDGDALEVRALLAPRMQMKRLSESVNMPELTESVQWLQLSDEEQEIYEILLEEDELTASEKLHSLRKFLINPALLEATPNICGSKIKLVKNALLEELDSKDKVVMFFNGYISDVIRGEEEAFLVQNSFGLNEDIRVLTIHGGTTADERAKIQDELKSYQGKILLLVSGQTADVGVDFSSADSVMFYNEPWTEYDKQQQRSRVYRYGQENDVNSTTFIAKNTIEEGIHLFIREKYVAVEKLLRGIPLKDIEKGILKAEEQQSSRELEVNPELAAYYFSSWDRMMKIFGHVKELGEDNFYKFLETYANDYARCYRDLGSRSYQANASRLSATLISSFAEERPTDKEIEILDLASGPEMLKRHIRKEHQDNIISIDINGEHFKGTDSDRRIVGSFKNIPIRDSSVDYVNFSLALHYTSFIPSKNVFERIEVLSEINRVLKPGGRAVMTLLYSFDLADEDKFKNAVEKLGFRVVEECTGIAKSGKSFSSRLVTLEKTQNITAEAKEIAGQIGKENLKGFKFKKNNASIVDSRKIATTYTIGDSREINVELNENDQTILEEEHSLIKQMTSLKNKYNGIENIPTEEIVNNGFARIYNGKSYVLFRHLMSAQGAIVIR